MGLPPPKLRNLAAWIEGNSTAGITPTEIWEIGVPAKKSLPWSIVLSVLLSESEVNFPDIVKKLTGDESEVKEIKGKKKLSLSRINADVIKKRLRGFNPFKNRHNVFHWEEISEIVRIFDLRLKRCAKNIQTSEWNDDLKLKAASRLLDCKIDVYFPKTREVSRYIEILSASPLENIILFEYKNQMHGARRDPMNIFNFSMKLQQVHHLKLDALRHFLKKAKISHFSRGKIMELMKSPETHGTAFLPTIIEKDCIDILPEIYQSPYITLRLSEAGFETDPIARISDKPSPLCCVLLCSTDPAYLRILYDYASNCRSLFDRSLRRADDTVLNNLKRIKSVVESDISILNSSDFEKRSKERALHIMNQLNRFIEYQSEIVNDLTKLKKKSKSKNIKTSHYRKEIVNTIVEHYLKFFQYGNESDNISQQLSDFIRFTEYYDFTDNFFYISFFDNFFKLKLLYRLGEEKVLSSHIEGKMCLAIQSNKYYFPTYVPLNMSIVDPDAINDNRNGNILRHIPLHYRNVVQSELVLLRQMLKDSVDSGIENCLKNGCNSYPEIIDEVLISRLNKYLDAVQEIDPETDNMVTVLVIERALQVIGESIKPPSSMGSNASFLLRSCLPTKLQGEFIIIRNDLSKYRCNSVYGKLEIEKNKKVFEGIKNELKQIQDAFKIVNFTQELRIKKLVMNECFNQLTNNLESNEYEKFREKYEFHLKQRTLDSAEHRKCIKLLLDSLSDLQEQSKKKPVKPKFLDLHMRNIFGQLKSIEYLIELIGKSEKYLDDLLKEVQNFSKMNKIEHDEIDKLMNNLSKWKAEILKQNLKDDTTLFVPNIESFYKSLKQNIFTEDERKQINTLVEKILQEALKAKCDLKDIFEKGFNKDSIPEVDKLLKKIPLPDNILGDIRSSYENKKLVGVSLKPLECLQKESKIKDAIKRMIESNSLESGYGHTVLTTIVFQRNSNLSSPGLPEEIYEKLENFLTCKVAFLLDRVKILKIILIDDDEEIRATWKWGRSDAIKHHLKFLMRQRYMRETTVCASLEMAYFDLLNIVHEPLPSCDEERETRADPDNYLATLSEKSTNLYSGFDLRHLLSHRNNIPEVIGEALDKDDFPSEMVEKIMQLINDFDAIEAMLKLFKKSGVIEEETFKDGIKESKFPKKFSDLIKTITDCDMWEKYIPHFPFVKTRIEFA